MSLQNYSLNLGLDLVPMSKDPDNLADLYRLYNAIKLVASQLDTVSGATPASPESWQTLGVTGGVTIQTSCKIYVPFVEYTYAGRLIALDSTGSAVLGEAGTVIGWAPRAVAAGEYGEVTLLGLHRAISGLTTGQIYYASTWEPGRISSGPSLTEGKRIQPVGVGLSPTVLFFNPQYLAPYVRNLQDGVYPNVTDLGTVGTIVANHALLSLD